MDWLSVHHVKIDCFTKTISILGLNGEQIRKLLAQTFIYFLLFVRPKLLAQTQAQASPNPT